MTQDSCQDASMGPGDRPKAVPSGYGASEGLRQGKGALRRATLERKGDHPASVFEGPGARKKPPEEQSRNNFEIRHIDDDEDRRSTVDNRRRVTEDGRQATTTQTTTTTTTTTTVATTVATTATDNEQPTMDAGRFAQSWLI